MLPIGILSVLPNTSNKYDKYVVNQSLEHLDDITFGELYGRMHFLVFYKRRFEFPKTRYLYLLCQSSRINSFNMAFNLETEIVEQWVKKSDVLMILHEIVLIELNANFNNISVISWRSVLLVDETGAPGENHAPTCH